MKIDQYDKSLIRIDEITALGTLLGSAKDSDDLSHALPRIGYRIETLGKELRVIISK